MRQNSIINNIVELRNAIIYKWHLLFASLLSSDIPKDAEAKFVVSIASYPKRDPLLPAVFQALSRQTLVPQKWILVLSEEDYTNGLPKHLQKLKKRGIEIIWVKDNPYAVKKLVPTIQKYPNLDVVTFDDELIYGKTVIERLVNARLKFPNAIIGHVGKELWQKNGKLGMLYRSSHGASIDTNSCQTYFLGGSGTYYPAHSLHKKVADIGAIHKIVPGRGSDIWFWAAAIAQGTSQICLGSKTNMSLYFAIPSKEQTKPLDTPGQKAMEDRFQKAIDYFEIREKLLQVLPEMSKD